MAAPHLEFLYRGRSVGLARNRTSADFGGAYRHDVGLPVVADPPPVVAPPSGSEIDPPFASPHRRRPFARRN